MERGDLDASSDTVTSDTISEPVCRIPVLIGVSSVKVAVMFDRGASNVVPSWYFSLRRRWKDRRQAAPLVRGEVDFTLVERLRCQTATQPTASPDNYGIVIPTRADGQSPL